MDAFITALVKLKVPTIIILGILYWSGIRLLRYADEVISLEGISGSVILCVAVVLTIIAFLDYRYKETTDSAISQLSKVITSLSRTLRTSNNTEVLTEKGKQETLKAKTDEQTIGNKNKKQYSVEDEDETLTD